MKTKKIKKFIAGAAAFAVAAVSAIIPTESGIGFNIVSSAAVTDGGIEMGYILPTDTDIDYDELVEAGYDLVTKPEVGSFDWSTLKTGDVFRVNIRVPDLAANLEGVQLEVSYDSTAFDVIKWYKTPNDTIAANTDYTNEQKLVMLGYGPEAATIARNTTEANRIISTQTEGPWGMWRDTGNIIGGTTGNANWVGGTLYVDCVADERNEATQIPNFNNSSAGNKLETLAKYSTDATTGVVSGNTKFNAGKYVTLSAIFIVKDAALLGETSFAIEDYDFYTIADPTVVPEVHNNLWNPTDVNCGVDVSIATAITGTIVCGYDSNGNPVYPEEDIIVRMTSYHAWRTEEQQVLGIEDCVSTDGTFAFRGVEPGVTYVIKVVAWCINDEKTVTITAGTKTQDVGEMNIRLIGDVDNDGIIGATDATYVLRYIVGKSSPIKSTTSDDYIAADVTEDSDLGAIDATHILRKTVGLPSVFDGHAAV